jgi:hypothetical protein
MQAASMNKGKPETAEQNPRQHALTTFSSAYALAQLTSLNQHPRTRKFLQITFAPTETNNQHIKHGRQGFQGASL